MSLTSPRDYILTKRRDDILAFLGRTRSSNGPTEAIKGRREHLCGNARGFRNLTNHIARPLLEAGEVRSDLHH